MTRLSSVSFVLAGTLAATGCAGDIGVELGDVAISERPCGGSAQECVVYDVRFDLVSEALEERFLDLDFIQIGGRDVEIASHDVNVATEGAWSCQGQPWEGFGSPSRRTVSLRIDRHEQPVFEVQCTKSWQVVHHETMEREGELHRLRIPGYYGRGRGLLPSGPITLTLGGDQDRWSAQGTLQGKWVGGGSAELE